MVTIKEVGNVKHVTTSEPIKLDLIRPKSLIQKKGTLTAQVRQILNTLSHYPSIKTSNSMKGGLVPTENFDITDQVFTSTENRLAFPFIPDNFTKEQVEKYLEEANKNGAVIYKTLSNKPILDEDQIAGINLGQTTVDIIANKQVVKVADNEETKKNGTAGKLLLHKIGDKSFVQYRRTDFWPTFREDVDLRDGKDVYLTPEIKAELVGASVLEGQEI